MRVDIHDVLREATCPACGHHVAAPFYDGGKQPLAKLAWPANADEARAMPQHLLDFVSCVDCGHIFNSAFDYAKVPYADKPNLMFNGGSLWTGFLEKIRDAMIARLPENPTVVEIGHGDGHLISALARHGPAGRYLGFDPHGVAESSSVEFRQALFEAAKHVPELRPDLIVSRHVLEHLSNPLGFIQSLSFAAAWCELTPLLYIEVPCADQALAAERTVDFYYEHNSHFTTGSFTRMLERCAVSVDEIGRGYDGEVIFAFARLGASAQQAATARIAMDFRNRAQSSIRTIRQQLAELTDRRVAIWGGTGKAAAFMNAHGVDADRFPIVVDSDDMKVGTFVPGTGQEIRFRDWLLEHPVEVIVIPMHWRARDIVDEMRACAITADQILIEYRGHLVDYFLGDHPYKDKGEEPAHEKTVELR